MNVVWLLLVCCSVAAAGFFGQMGGLTGAMVGSAKSAVELAIGLAGGWCLWLGLMRVVERAGLMQQIARAMLPVLERLFPQVPKGHPAHGAMVMNFAANVLGMDNAATAFGLKAMHALATLNRAPAVATDAMILFLAINTAGIQAIPMSVVAARAAIDPTSAGRVVLPTIVVSVLTSVTAVLWTGLLARLPMFARTRPDALDALGNAQEEVSALPRETPSSLWRVFVLALSVLVMSALCFAFSRSASALGLSAALRDASGWLLAVFAAAMLLYGAWKGVKVYEAAIEGAKEGFDVAIRILPYLVLILVAVGLWRASGLMEALTRMVSPLSDVIGLPAAVLPQALVRPLSGSAAMGVLVDILQREGPDSLAGFVASVIYGSSETTFYVLGVYFGAVGVRSLRHALLACLLSDATGILVAVWVARAFY